MLFLLPLLLLQANLEQVRAQPSFTYTTFSKNEDLILSGNATISDGELRLTSDNNFSYGRAVRSQGISFCSKNSPLSFTTDLTFLIHTKGNSPFADGFAFFIAPMLKSPSSKSFGRYLGLMEPEDNGKPTNHLIAVEFDTRKNIPPDYPDFRDIDGNHVGVDVNSMVSENSSSLSPFGLILSDGQPLAARIDYDASIQKMSVYVSTDLNFTSMVTPVLEHNINLCLNISNTSYIGLSAGSGSANVNFHDISSWKFTSRLSTEHITTPSPSSPPSSSPSDPPSSPPSDPPSSPGPGSTRGTSTNSSATSKESKNSASFKAPIFGTGAGILIVLILLIMIYFFLRRKRGTSEELVLLPQEIKYSDIVQATDKFHESNLLGKGGFGSVYKGTLPKDKSTVAVKRVSEKSSQGEREFLTEVKIISSLSHRNLVKLRGWCRKQNELILVYEFMSQGSVEQALFTNNKDLLLWSTRYKIISGLAAAVLYLHEEWEQQVLHRDIKCSNVMLDSNFNARLGDFGLARVLEQDTNSRTTNVAGTIGYIAPEVGYTYKLTPASDVYSFGVVVLEIVCGKKVVSEEMLLMPWIEGHVEGETLLRAVDPRLHDQFDAEEVLRVLQMALKCVESDPKNRPSMRQVVHTFPQKPASQVRETESSGDLPSSLCDNSD